MHEKMCTMRKKSLHIRIFPGIIALLTFSSCSDFLDVKPKDVVDEKNHFNNVYDADAAVRGIYGKLVNLADEYVILNELRADLMDVTDYADYSLREINLHQATTKNPYANPQKFYSLINDCNDAMVNFNQMLVDLKLSKEAYNQRYTDITAVRTWLFLQLVIQYGEVPYITSPIDQVDDLQKLKNGEFPVLKIEPMVDSLVKCMENLPYLNLYTDESMITFIDGFNTKIMFIDKEYLLGELYLWQGEYEKAASQFKNVMERDIGLTKYDSYKLRTDFFTNDYYNSRYERYYEHDINSVVNNWPLMFSDFQNDSYYSEWIWVLYFSENYAPENPFIDLFALNGGRYLIKPSEVAIENWKSGIQKNGFSSDFRGENSSYIMEGGYPVINKYIAGYDPILTPFDKSGKWFLWRASGLHLKFSEAANRDGYSKLAYALMNDGIRATYADTSQDDFFTQNQTNLPFPYDFDGRQTGITDNPPGVRGLYYRNMGIRGRVFMKAMKYPDRVDSLTYTEDKILDEAALELAFEGNRWGDLVRIAIRRNDPSILADRIYNKLHTAGYPEAEAVRTKLMDRQNWFIPLK
jgi:starch-binding outer membrane protein, SusD/RagB family